MKVSAVQKRPSTITARIARTLGAWPEALIAAKGATITAPTLSENRVVVLGGTFLSLYCTFTMKLERAPLAAAPRTARAPRIWPTELTAWRPTTRATPTSPTTSPAAWTRFISTLRSKRGAKIATNMGVEETSTPASPEGTESSPSEIRMKGAAMASTPSKIAGKGLLRISPIIWRALPPS
jgi:hypothetical protein